MKNQIVKQLLLLTLLIGALQTAQAQIETPVTWSYAFKKTKPDEAVIFLKANIESGWHVYSQTVRSGGPVKTTFTFPATAEYTLVGKTIEPKPISRFEKVFGMEVAFFENSVIFQQKIKLKKGQTTVKGQLEYMTCNDQKCLPPTTEEFNIPVK